jgi:hypothetical protein
LHFDWDDSGQWSYVNLADHGYNLKVPTENGLEEIELCVPSTPKETLGVFTAPGDGNSDDQMEKIRDKVAKWTSRICGGNLPAAFVWVSYTFQLWMGIRYGLGVMPATMEEVSGFLQDFYYKMLPHMGVNRKIKTGWRTIHRAFCGVGLFDFDTELLIARLNILLQHFDSPLPVGITLRACMEAVQLEAGLLDCPFNHPFGTYGVNFTHCWVRSLWQSLSFFNFQLNLQYPSLPFPREQDRLLLDIFMANNPLGIDFISWNCCRLYLRALTLRYCHSKWTCHRYNAVIQTTRCFPTHVHIRIPPRATKCS